MTDDAPLTERQHQMMAYVDDELGAGERAAFERALADDPQLAMETAQLKSLLDLSRATALAEPSDREVRRFWAKFYNRTEWRLGWVLLIAGLVVLAGESLHLLMTSDLAWTWKAAVLSTLLGGLLLLCNTLRIKVRTSRFDRYRGVLR